MLAIKLTVPIACWRKGYAREFLESEKLPPPATCYGALLSLVGETDRRRHRGCRVTAGHCTPLGSPSTVLRTLWRVKSNKVPQGSGCNARPDFQQLFTDTTLILFCDRGDEQSGQLSLEDRVRTALKNPASVERFGGWSLGESTHLINDVWLLEEGIVDTPCEVFLCDPKGDLTLPIWVDHVGSAGTRYAVGKIERITQLPEVSRIPKLA
ncbi:MAG TPA: type I-MYXAN CRISPR-associated protein Cas5/Cmx5/DevS [Pseudomonadota bacterium]|nr:type I-MYXAN CRISPR-associated protein Cas5/Cmx5/DevS [Pseudomonadota bacterium]